LFLTTGCGSINAMVYYNTSENNPVLHSVEE
jgi:hypothetical protein